LASAVLHRHSMPKRGLRGKHHLTSIQPGTGTHRPLNPPRLGQNHNGRLLAPLPAPPF
jgi:hypothetical protein